jgi:mono/diheme cytochrome c family protein
MRFLFVLSLLIIFVACGKTDYRQGKNLYAQHCTSCHMDDGKGLGKLIPPLANSDWLKNNQEVVTCLLINGMEGEIIVNDTSYNQPMPGNGELSDFQVTNIINYINHAWGNDYGIAIVADVRSQAAGCQ